MRKTTINPVSQNNSSSNLDFLDLEQLAQVEISSECSEHPVESALLLNEDSGAGWRAASPGEQTIRVVFDQPCAIERIFLEFDEQQQSRTQEFVLLGLIDNESAYREILRQQYHFSPPNTTQEIEHYEVKLSRLKALELRIIPDIGGGDACATLKKLRLG
ncbi:MAG: carbohydrate-binding protein [Methylococcaceae bacterium]